MPTVFGFQDDWLLCYILNIRFGNMTNDINRICNLSISESYPKYEFVSPYWILTEFSNMEILWKAPPVERSRHHSQVSCKETMTELVAYKATPFCDFGLFKTVQK